MNMKKIISLVLALCMLLACVPAMAAGYTAGTYTAEVRGMQAIKVSVTFSADAITDIQLEQNETPGVGTPVCETMPQQIIELQGLGLDIVAGATLTSQAILDGVAECVKQAGGDVEALKAIKPAAKEKEEDVELTADVVVIGAGGAGMAAAITANQAGKSVIVVEKTGAMGGNTILSGGALNAVDEGSEAATLREDSVEKHYTQTFNGGDQQGDPELVRKLVTEAWDGVEWLMSIGMEFSGKITTVAGSLWERGHVPVEPEGVGFFKAYGAYVDSHEGIDMLYKTRATDLIVENGVVTGVVCTGETGNTVTVKANGGVVIATGGFAQNVEMRQKANAEGKLWEDLGDTIKSTNTSAITGDGIAMAQAVGAQTIQMGNIQLLPQGDPETGSLSGNIGHGPVSFIFLNLDGNRFVDEGGRRDDMTKGLIAQEQQTMYMLMDSDTYPNGTELNNFGEHINDLVAAGRAFKADTLEEMAEKIGLPVENVVKTVTEYNRHCVGGDLEGQPDEFGRTLYTDANKINDGINDGPFYACRRVPTVHHTMGGLKINTNTEVIDVNGNVIPGLYAAGEVTGGIHGTNRLGGNALTDIVVFGRTAGAQAAAFTK